MTTFTVHTIAQVANPSSKMEPVTVGTRATKDADGNKKIISADQRTRSILIPELHASDLPSRFQMYVLDALRNTAKQQLSSLWDADSMLKEVPANIWSVDSLLAFAAREAESKRLTKASLHYWFEASQLAAVLRAKDAANETKLYADWQAKIVGMSAPAMTASEAECNAIINTLAKETLSEDAESFIGQQIVAKCVRRIDALRKQMDEVSIDELDI